MQNHETQAARNNTVLAIAIALPAVAFFIGWKTFWFMTDDAYIAFRYISNSILGFGYVWNAPPFLPVEGYTSFGWVVLLEWVWKVTGFDPPRSANPVAFVFACGSFALTAYVAATMPLRETLERWRPALVFAVLAGCASNRTFLAWGSSGLETALFNFCVLLWVYAVVAAPRENKDRFFLVALSSTLIYLTRPDGMLFVLVSLFVLARLMLAQPPAERWKIPRLTALIPLVVVPVHLIWRRSFYGNWVPNTYVAKYTGPWPESGVRYALSFIMEYALWVWGVVLVMWLVARRRTGDRSRFDLSRALGVLTVAAHAGYYTFVIGGDHFEYRVYSQLVPLVMLSFVWLANAIEWSGRRAVGVFALFLLLSLPIPWIHWQKTRHLTTRQDTLNLAMPVADAFPVPMRWYVQGFDGLQAWLVSHAVCIRHQEHKVFHDFQVDRFPTREEGATLGAEGYPIYLAYTVGVPSWVMPHVNILDRLGLNDYVIARSPYLSERRVMAHSRRAPDDYIESYQPNVGFLAGEQWQWWRSKNAIPYPIAAERPIPFTAEHIAELEKRWHEWADQIR